MLLFVSLAVGCVKGDVHQTDIIEMSWSNDIDEVVDISFEYLQESKYDLDALLKNRGLEEDVPFLFVEHMSVVYFLEKLEEEGRFSYTNDFDFENFDMIISYSREIIELDCVSSEWIRHHYGSQWYRLRATIGEDYFCDTIFFYRIAKVNGRGIIRTHYDLDTFVMNGTEKTQVYWSQINRPKSTGLEGVR